MPQLRSTLSRLDTTPAHDSCTRVDIAIKDFIPTDNLTSLAVDIFLNAVGKVSLQLVQFQVILVSNLLTFRAFAPACGRSFITTNVDVLGREDVGNFINDIIDKLINLFIPQAEHVLINAPSVTDLIRPACTTKFGISS